MPRRALQRRFRGGSLAVLAPDRVCLLGSLLYCVGRLLLLNTFALNHIIVSRNPKSTNAKPGPILATRRNGMR